MTKRSTYGGSLAAVIIVILFVALMATLGIVFYQNFIQKPQTSTTTDSNNTTKTAVQKTARVAFNDVIYAVDYPDSGWTVSSKAAQSGSYIMAVSTSGSVKVYMSIAPTTAKDPCDSTDGLQIDNYSSSPSPVVTKLTDNPLYLVRAITDVKGGGYQYVVGLMPDGGETHASVGASHCGVAYVGMTDPLVLSGSTVVKPAISTSITFPKLPSLPKAAAPDMQAIKDLMNSDDYKAAVKILESARKE